MMDPREFKAPFITIEDIRSAVAEFRNQYWPRDTIPVDIFAIVEFELDIEIRTIVNLRETGDVDALLRLPHCQSTLQLYRCFVPMTADGQVLNLHC